MVASIHLRELVRSQALIYGHMAGVAEARAINVAGLNSSPFAVFCLVAVRSADCSIVYSAVLAWNLAICLH